MEETFRNIITQIQKNLECSICLELLSCPVSTKCDHQFCRFCITKFLLNKRSVPCPLCKAPVTKRGLQERTDLNNIITNVKELIIAFETDTGEKSIVSDTVTKKSCLDDASGTINSSRKSKRNSTDLTPVSNLRNTSKQPRRSSDVHVTDASQLLSPGKASPRVNKQQPKRNTRRSLAKTLILKESEEDSLLSQPAQQNDGSKNKPNTSELPKDNQISMVAEKITPDKHVAPTTRGGADPGHSKANSATSQLLHCLEINSLGGASFSPVNGRENVLNTEDKFKTKLPRQLTESTLFDVNKEISNLFTDLTESNNSEGSALTSRYPQRNVTSIKETSTIPAPGVLEEPEDYQGPTPPGSPPSSLSSTQQLSKPKPAVSRTYTRSMQHVFQAEKGVRNWLATLPETNLDQTHRNRQVTNLDQTSCNKLLTNVDRTCGNRLITTKDKINAKKLSFTKQKMAQSPQSADACKTTPVSSPHHTKADQEVKSCPAEVTLRPKRKSIFKARGEKDVISTTEQGIKEVNFNVDPYTFVGGQTPTRPASGQLIKSSKCQSRSRTKDKKTPLDIVGQSKDKKVAALESHEAETSAAEEKILNTEMMRGGKQTENNEEIKSLCGDLREEESSCHIQLQEHCQGNTEASHITGLAAEENLNTSNFAPPVKSRRKVKKRSSCPDELSQRSSEQMTKLVEKIHEAEKHELMFDVQQASEMADQQSDCLVPKITEETDAAREGKAGTNLVIDSCLTMEKSISQPTAISTVPATQEISCDEPTNSCADTIQDDQINSLSKASVQVKNHREHLCSSLDLSPSIFPPSVIETLNKEKSLFIHSEASETNNSKVQLTLKSKITSVEDQSSVVDQSVSPTDILATDTCVHSQVTICSSDTVILETLDVAQDSVHTEPCPKYVSSLSKSQQVIAETQLKCSEAILSPEKCDTQSPHHPRHPAPNLESLEFTSSLLNKKTFVKVEDSPSESSLSVSILQQLDKHCANPVLDPTQSATPELCKNLGSSPVKVIEESDPSTLCTRKAADPHISPATLKRKSVSNVSQSVSSKDSVRYDLSDSEDEDSVLIVRRSKRKCFSLDSTPLKPISFGPVGEDVEMLGETEVMSMLESCTELFTGDQPVGHCLQADTGPSVLVSPTKDKHLVLVNNTEKSQCISEDAMVLGGNCIGGEAITSPGSSSHAEADPHPVKESSEKAPCEYKEDSAEKRVKTKRGLASKKCSIEGGLVTRSPGSREGGLVTRSPGSREGGLVTRSPGSREIVPSTVEGVVEINVSQRIAKDDSPKRSIHHINLLNSEQSNKASIGQHPDTDQSIGFKERTQSKSPYNKGFAHGIVAQISPKNSDIAQISNENNDVVQISSKNSDVALEIAYTSPRNKDIAQKSPGNRDELEIVEQKWPRNRDVPQENVTQNVHRKKKFNDIDARDEISEDEIEMRDEIPDSDVIPLTSSPLNRNLEDGLEENLNESIIDNLSDEENDEDEDDCGRIRRKIRKRQLSSDSEDHEKDLLCPSNNTSSSASQSEILTTQQQEALEGDLQKLNEEIAKYEAQLGSYIEKSHITKTTTKVEDDVMTVEDSCPTLLSSDDSNDLFISPIKSPIQNKKSRANRKTMANSRYGESKLKQFQSPGGSIRAKKHIEFLPSNGQHSDKKTEKMSKKEPSQPISHCPEDKTKSKEPVEVFQLSPLEGQARPASPVILSQKSKQAQQSLTRKTEHTVSPRHDVAKKICLVASGLGKDDNVLLAKFIEKFGVKFTPKFTKEVSHVIMKTVEGYDRVCDRTLRFFQGVAHKCWILSLHWVASCLQTGRLLPEVAFEIEGDTSGGEVANGARRSRLTKDPLFRDFCFACVGECEEMPKESLFDVLLACGASTVEDPIALLSQKEKYKFIVRCSDSNNPPSPVELDIFNGFYKHMKLLTVMREWVLDSLGSYTLVPLEEYLLNTGDKIQVPF